MDRATRDRAIDALGRVLGIGLSWALVWLAFWLAVHALIEAYSPSPAAIGLTLGLAVSGLVLGIAFGGAHAFASGRRRISEVSLTRTLTCAFFACAFVEILYLGYRDSGLGLDPSVRLVLAVCVFGQFVTMLWYAAVRGARAGVVWAASLRTTRQ